MNKSLWAASCCLIVVGLLFLAAGCACQIYQMLKEPLKGRTTARVVDLVLQETRDKRPSSGFKNCYYPVFEYYAEGRLYKEIFPYGAYPSPFHLNQELTLWYNKEDPREYHIAGRDTMKIIAELLYAAGVICLLGGCIIFLLFAVRG